MPETNQGQKPSEPLSTDFSWETLPELAKDRWEQMVAYSSTIENQLANAKASRTQAEGERQRIAKEILSATKEACQEIVADAKRDLDRSSSKTEEAERQQQEAKLQLDEAKTIRSEAESYRDAVLARAEQQAEELKQRAQAAAEAAGNKLKQQVAFEAQSMLAQAEVMRAAAEEELEAQRIYAEAAMLIAEAHEALEQIKTQFLLPEHPRVTHPDGNGATRENDKGLREAAQTENRTAQAATSTVALEAPEQPPVKLTEPVYATSATDQPKPSDSNIAPAGSEPTPAPKADSGGGVPQRGRSKDRRATAA